MTTHALTAASPPQTAHPAPPLTFDERLTFAVQAVDARIDTTPFNLADVIRIPVDTPPTVTPTPCPYTTPIAGTLHRARVHIETYGWCRDALRDEQGARCPIGAIRIEASSRAEADDACVLLLDAIQADFANAETIPSWNAEQTEAGPVLLYLGRAAQLAHTRGV